MDRFENDNGISHKQAGAAAHVNVPVDAAYAQNLSCRSKGRSRDHPAGIRKHAVSRIYPSKPYYRLESQSLNVNIWTERSTWRHRRWTVSVAVLTLRVLDIV